MSSPMKTCMECGVDIVRRKFCSKKCAGVFRSRNACLISEQLLREEYLEKKLELLEIAKQHEVSVVTVCNYLKRYNIEARTKYIDFSGQQIGELSVIEPLVTGHKGGGKHVKWRCRCSCGKEHHAFSHHLSRSLSVRCSSCSCKNRRSPLELKAYMWTNIKRSAINRGLDFAIDREWAYQLFLKQNRLCILSNEPIGFALCVAEHQQGCTTASLDRIESDKGYVVGNVQWVHKIVNFMKGSTPECKFVEWCKKISKHRQLCLGSK